jgi:ADP-heptose:LPS heptosyltransferase
MRQHTTYGMVTNNGIPSRFDVNNHLQPSVSVAHQLKQRLAAPFADRPFTLQRICWPNPFRPPYQASEINLFRPGELGDVLMSLAVVRGIRLRNPTAKITFITNYHELLHGHPLIDRVMSPETAVQFQLQPVISLRYEVFVPLRLHVIDYLAGCVGLREIEHSIPLPDFTSELGTLQNQITGPRPWIVVSRHAGPFTPNKDWPDERWTVLIPRLARNGTVIELGTAPPGPKLATSHIDLRTQTNLRQYCGLISLADLVISPITSAVHVAAAYGVPSLSIMGGYESPANTAYPLHTPLYRALSCSPCWLRTPCPFDRECLRQISVDEVAETAAEILAKRAPFR